jgi:cell surface protein SprA
MWFFILVCLSLHASYSGRAQDTDVSKQPLPKINLNVDGDVVVYDPDTDSYLYYRKGEEKDGKPYKVLSKKEYNEETIRDNIGKTWRTKHEEATAANEANRSRGLLPQLRTRVDNEIFGTVFGGNDVAVNFNGMVEAKFEIRSTKINNPLTPPQYRRTITPNFSTLYNLNLTGNIGERIKINFTFDPNSTFNFETNLRLGYEGSEDDILQTVEIGNITMPLNSTLITGSQSLFGGKVGLRFGKLDMTLVASQQRGQSKTVEVRGGAQSNFFDLQADQYEANQHFFLAQYFHENYEKSLSQMPLIVSGIQITKVEVWVTNKTNRTDNVRNIVAFMDLAEPNAANIYNNIPAFRPSAGQSLPSNAANGEYAAMNGGMYNIRNFAEINHNLQSLSAQGFTAGQDYEKLERARLLNQSEYTLNSQLGYISLNTSLNSDEVLAVAFEYTYNGRTFKVGEMSTAGTTASDSTLILKMLKGTILTPKLPTWKLMMKNIYRLEGSNLDSKNFVLDVFYEDSELGTAVPYISEGPFAKQPLISVIGLDRVNTQLDPYPDGLFDYITGITVEPTRARIIFPVLEPFGRYLEKKFAGDPSASKYIYKELYDSTLTKAREYAEKNRFRLRGSYEAKSRSEISLGAMNVPEGSVTVTAGGVKLLEGIDYQVNYMSGTVTILNQSYLESGMPISISLEDRSLFNMQTKTILGANLNYKFSDNFQFGGTIMHLNEKPMTQKVAYGEDAVSNTIWGLNMSYRTESNTITNLVNKIPFLETKAKSGFNFDAEFAQLISGSARGIKGKVFIDDFDGAKSFLDLRNYLAWTLASTPQGQSDLFPEGNKSNDVSAGYNRAKLAWNWIDPELTRNSSSTPSYYRQNPGKYQDNLWVCNIPVKDIYPNRQLLEGTPPEIQTLNLNFYPRERGPYNYDPVNVDSKGFLFNPEKRWGGIMRSMPVTDFETANYDYIEFWVLDPFTYNKNSKGGDFYINLGTISEDILRDGYKSYEQGIPFPLDTSKVIKTAWGYVPKAPALVNTFDGDETSRRGKDVGLDGINSERETSFFGNFLQNVSALITDQTARDKLLHDPSSDDFVFYRDGRYDQQQATILDRYKDFNNPEGNSSQSGSGDNSNVYTINPDMEDINRDNTMEENESYFQYHIHLTPGMKVGEQFITDIKEYDTIFANSGNKAHVRWYQFKVPLSEYQKAVGPISDFKSIRFMRMFLRNFSDTTVLRFASLELARNEWRKFNYSLIHGQEGLTQPEMPETGFEVSVVNIEENSQRLPVNYVLPPGTDRVIDPNTIQERQLNEQALQLVAKNIPDGDARAVYKTLKYDIRQYRRLQMDVHAEALPADMSLRDDDLSVFIRMGSDLKNNYYEYEIPLKLTAAGFYGDNQREQVWRPENMLDIELSEFTDLKIYRNTNAQGSANVMFERKSGDHILRVMGNPNLGEVKAIMIGVRNPINKEKISELGVSKSGTIWVNELRLTDLENKGGWAATANMGLRLADFGNISLSGGITTAGFGGLEQRQTERSQEDIYRYDLLSSFELGKFFPQSVGVHIPIFFGYSERFANPLYDPLSQDIKYRDAMRALTTRAQKDSLRNLAQDYTRRKSFNVTNMRVAPEGSTPGILRLSNLSLSFSFNETFQHNVNLERYLYKEYRGALTYGYSISPLYIEPFKKIGFLKSSWFTLIRDFNFNLVPNQFQFSTDMYRMYSERQNRNIAYPEAKLPGTFAKDFTWNRHYNLSWNLTRSTTLTYSATNVARIDEPVGMVDKRRDPTGYRHWRDSTWNNIMNFGRNVHFSHNANLTWQLPFNKLKLIDWINGNTQYNIRYNWDAAPIMREDEFGYVYDPGNTIANGRTLNGNLNFQFANLYNKSKWLKDVNDQFDRKKRNTETVEVKFESKPTTFNAKRRRTINHGLGTTNIAVKVVNESGKTLKAQTETSGNNKVFVTLDETVKNAKVLVTGKVPKKDGAGKTVVRFGARMLMMLRDGSITYIQDESTLLPGFKGVPSMLGLNSLNGSLAPGWNFVFGGQATDFLMRAKAYGWITGDSTMTNPFVMRKSTTLTVRLNFEPVKDLQIILTGNRSRMHDMTSYNITGNQGLTQAIGSFEISTITIATAFEKSTAANGYKSNAFDNFNKYRQTIAWRQANQRRAVSGGAYNPGGGQYPVGYSGLSQDVVVPAFLAAYTGASPENVTLNHFPKIPLPNWDISYQGLSKAEFFKRYFKSGRISHKYSSKYIINAYNQNAEFDPDYNGLNWIRNELGDFITQNNFINASIREDFNPLFRLDLDWKNDLKTNFSVNKNRTIGLSLANNQIIEDKNTAYTIELGYFFRKVPLIFKFGEDRQKKIDTDLRVTGNLSIIDKHTFLRSLEETEQETQISNGNKIVSMGLSADYSLHRGVTLKAFFEHNFNNPYVSAISVSNTNFGFSLRVTLSQ